MFPTTWCTLSASRHPYSWVEETEIYSSLGFVLMMDIEKKVDWQCPCFQGAHFLMAEVYSKRACDVVDIF